MSRERTILLVIGVIALLIISIFITTYFSSLGGGGSTSSYIEGGVIFLGSGDPEELYLYSFEVVILGPDALYTVSLDKLPNDDLVLGYVSLGKVVDEKYVSLLASKGLVHEINGTIFVEYWEPDWRSVLMSEVKRFHDSGVGGVVLDDADVYFYLESVGVEWAGGRDLYVEMRNLIADIIQFCRNKFGDSFKVFVGFSDELSLLNDLYIYNNIDGVVFKGLWHELSGEEVIKVCECEIKHIFAVLDKALDADKLVIVVDPVGDVSDAREFCKVARLRGYIPIPQPGEHWGFDEVAPIDFYG